MPERRRQAVAQQEWMRSQRRHLHRHPEVGLDLPDTHAHIASVLRDLGFEPEIHPSAGVTAVIPGRDPGRATVLRSDMDALPVAEDTGLPFSSERAGAMHACGHDLHMAMLLGAAACLASEPPLHDTVLVFQPGEESDRGAVPTLSRHRNLDRPVADTFALHVHATWPAGTVFHRAGAFMAAGDWFEITFRGPGAHASQPHLAGNPVVAGSDFVTMLRTAVADLARTEHLVATVTESQMGNTVNVIPTSGRLRGTLRTLSPEQRTSLHGRLQALAEEAAQSSDLSVDVVVTEGYPAVVNDSDYVARLAAALDAAEVPAESMPEPSMVIEDFAYFLQRWPGAMAYLGAQVPGHNAFNHAADAVFDDDVLAVGAALHLLAADGWPA